MVDPKAASVKIVDAPCISIVRLLDLRAFLDSGLAFHLGEQIPEGGSDGEALDEGSTGFVRRAGARHEAWGDRAGEGDGADSIAPDGGDGNLEKWAGDGR
jgi:hypothetical protein